MNNTYDLLIIGGGINGCGIAADAAGRGLSVLLCEQDDLANHTSSASSKLIHGGLRYLEHYEFRLVREALKERDILIKNAPHLIHPRRIIMPHQPHLRPTWLIRLGLYLYDHLYWHQSFPHSKAIRLKPTPDNPLSPNLKRGFVYSDASVDDSRLTISNALAAKAHGATIKTRHKVIKAKRQQNHWHVHIDDKTTDTTTTIHCKAIVNAAGPWVDPIIQACNSQSQHHIRLVKGSHIVTRQQYPGDQAYLLQNPDQRIIFMIPYQQHFTLIGTTDTPFNGDPRDVNVDDTERQYLLNAANQYLKNPIQQHDIVWEYAGVRALDSDDHNNPSKVTRDYHLDLNDNQGQCPLLSLFGGKITTYRRLAEHALERLAPYFPNMKPAWTASTPLPGGDIENFSDFIQSCQKHYSWLPQPLCQRYANSYGSRIHQLLQDCHKLSDLGEDLGHGLYEAEKHFLREQEWAMTDEDILWRRTKLGLIAQMAP